MNVFDLSNPKHRQKVEAHLVLLEGRRHEQIEVLHYLRRATGGVLCLDLSLTAATEQELDEKVCQQLATTPPCQIAEASPTTDWMAMVNGSLEGQRLLRDGRLPRGAAVVSVCREAK